MSNKPEDFCDYFKIRWAMRSTWTIEHAAYLLCGKDPELKDQKISPDASTKVSKLYYWLENKYQAGIVHALGKEGEYPFFNVGTLYRLVKDSEKFAIDVKMERALGYSYDGREDKRRASYITKSVYREAGSLVSKQYPIATKMDIAKSIENLPSHFNSVDNDLCHIEKKSPEQISEFLKGLNHLKQKPKDSDVQKIEIDLAQLVEKMKLFSGRKNA